MATNQQIIKQALTEKEISHIRGIIKNNKEKPNNTVWAYEEWHSADGLSFQITKNVSGTDYLIEVTLENIEIRIDTIE